MTLKELLEKYPAQNFGPICVKRIYDFVDVGHIVFDHTPEDLIEDTGWEVWLNLEEEWALGTLEQAKTFSNNLIQAIAHCEANP